MESKLFLLATTFLCMVFHYTLTSATTHIKTDAADYDPATGGPNKSTSLLLSKILEDPEQARELVRLLEALEARRWVAGAHRATSDETRKREAAWDMDYGWGGGRFGKRMDTLGMAGRFGRSVERAEAAKN